jgi:hypothetical protein
VQVAAFLVRSEKGNCHFAAAADLAIESFADFSQGKVGTVRIPVMEGRHSD